MEMMKKIGMVLVVAALGVAGYVLVNRYSAMPELGNVVVQIKNPFSKKNMEKAGGDINKAFGNGGDVDLGLPCQEDSHCKSNFCKQGTCHSTTGACARHSDCTSDHFCAENRTCTAKRDGDSGCAAGFGGVDQIEASCKYGARKSGNGYCYCKYKNEN